MNTTGIVEIFKATSRSAVSGKWENVLPTGRFENGEMVECSMRPSQRELHGMKDSPLLIGSQPPGGGKSTAIKFCHIDDVISNSKRKLVVAVPLEGIAKTFGEVTLVFDDGKTIKWSPRVNLCKPTNGTSKLDLLLDFLACKDFTQDYGERICICTHDLLEAAYKQIKDRKEAECLDLFSNITVVIDEGHHVLNTDNSLGRVNNLLGNLIDFLVKNRGKIENSKVWFTTATYVRGDRLDILSNENFSLFKRYSLPLDRHWRENFRYIQDYSYGFVSYPSVQGPFDSIEIILKERQEPTIIYLPRMGSNQAKWCSNGCKMTYLRKVKDSISKVWPDAVVLDLVDTNGREDRKQDILMVEKEIEKVDIILTISMMDEGIDWPHAVQVLDLAPSSSLRIAIQRFGRLLRDVEGKKHIYYVLFMQSCLDQMLDPEGYKHQLNEAHAALTSSLLIEEMIQPVNIIPKTKGERPDPIDESKFVNWFIEDVPDEGKRAKILEDIEKELLIRRGKADAKGRKFLGIKVAKDVVLSRLRRAKVKHIDEVARQIIAMLRRRTLPYGSDMSWAVDAGFNELYDDSILNNLLGYVAKGCGVETFAKYRKISQSCNDTIWDENIQYTLDFKAREKRLPSKDSKDPKEAYVGRWLLCQAKKKEFIALAKMDGKVA